MADLTALTAIVVKLLADIATMISVQANQQAQITAQQAQITTLQNQLNALQAQIASDPQGQPAVDNLTAQLTVADNNLVAAIPTSTSAPTPAPAPAYIPTPAPAPATPTV